MDGLPVPLVVVDMAYRPATIHTETLRADGVWYNLSYRGVSGYVREADVLVYEVE